MLLMLLLFQLTSQKTRARINYYPGTTRFHQLMQVSQFKQSFMDVFATKNLNSTSNAWTFKTTLHLQVIISPISFVFNKMPVKMF